jgi:hypothetical protein
MHNLKLEHGRYECVGFFKVIFSTGHTIQINLLLCNEQDTVHVDQPITKLIITWKERSTLACRGLRPCVPPASQTLDAC